MTNQEVLPCICEILEVDVSPMHYFVFWNTRIRCSLLFLLGIDLCSPLIFLFTISCRFITVRIRKFLPTNGEISRICGRLHKAEEKC